MNEKYVPTKTKIKIGLWYKYQITLKEEKKILETKWFCMLIKLLIPSGRKKYSELVWTYVHYFQYI